MEEMGTIADGRNRKMTAAKRESKRLTMDRYIALRDFEATQAAKGELRALVRVIPDIPPKYKWAGWVMDTTGDQRLIGQASWYKGGEWPDVTDQIYRKSPFGYPGDVLHCPETWYEDVAETFPISAMDVPTMEPIILYKADNPMCFYGHWRSPILMPHWAIRHHYRVVESRAILATNLSYFNEMKSLGFRGDYDGDIETAQNNFMDTYKITNPDQWLWFAKVEAIK